jgi:hypothetical protein
MIAHLLLLLAAAAGPQPGAACKLDGWSNDTDPAGLRVRAGPSLAAREIGRLPPAFTGDDSHAPEFDILDVQNGWVKIANAVDADNPGKPRPIFKGVGWVHGSRVEFSIQTNKGRAGPDIGAPVVVEGEDLFSEAGGRAQPISGCSGGWVRLRYTLPAGIKPTKGPRTGEAWFGGVCGNQHTTCDGLDETKSLPGRLRP